MCLHLKPIVCFAIFLVLLPGSSSSNNSTECQYVQNYELAEEFAKLIVTENGGKPNGGLGFSQFSDLLQILHLAEWMKGSDTVVVNGAEALQHGQTHQNCTDSDKRLPCTALTKCMSASQLFDLVPHSNIINPLNASQLVNLCPALLYQIYHGFCSTNQQTPEAHRQPEKWEVWLYGMLFVTIISLCSLVGVSVLPLMGKSLYNRLLTFLIGLAVGSLSSSAVFHLIPQAFNLIPQNGNTNHDYLWTSLVLMGGIYLFFMTERIMKIILEAKKRTYQNKYRTSEQDDLKRQMTDSSLVSVGTSPEPENHIIYNWTDRGTKTNHKHEHHIEFKKGEDSAVATVAWMIIFGDGLHNFIDGLSIGAGFSQSILTGVSISVAVICEEFPHELGDFAVLLNAGMSMKQALLYNLLSATTCYLGLMVGILLGELSDNSNYIFALAAGMFLYISLVDMVPELNEEAMQASKVSVYCALKVLFIQNLGWLTGVVTLFLLAYNQGNITFE